MQSKQDAYTDADLQAAVAGVAQAEAAVALAQANLDQTTVVAPFDGVIGSRHADRGRICHAVDADPDAGQRQGVEVHVTVEEAHVAPGAARAWT